MTTFGTEGDTPRGVSGHIDVLIAIPVMRDEADLWESVARHYRISPIDLVHLSALSGLQYQLRRNKADEHAELVENTIRRLAATVGLTPIERQEGDPEPQTFVRETGVPTNDT